MVKKQKWQIGPLIWSLQLPLDKGKPKSLDLTSHSPAILYQDTKSLAVQSIVPLTNVNQDKKNTVYDVFGFI